MHIDNVPNVIAACCVLLNICEVHQDSFNDDWLQEIEAQMDQCAGVSPSTSVQSSSHAGGDQVCNILLEYFHLTYCNTSTCPVLCVIALFLLLSNLVLLSKNLL